MFNIPANKTIIKFILSTLKPFKILIFWQFIIMLICAVEISLKPYLLKVIIDKTHLLNNDNIIQELGGIISAYLGISLLLTIVFRFYDYIWLKLNPGLKRDIGNVLMNKMMLHSMEMLNNHFVGNLANKIKDVMSGTPDLVKLFIQEFLSNLLALIFAIFTLSTINYKFSILLSLWIMIFTSGSFILSKFAKILCIKAAEVRSIFMGEIVDILGNIMNVHLFATRENESNRIKARLDDYVIADQRRDWLFLKMSAWQGFTFIIYQIITFISLISGFKNGSVSSGDIALIVTINIALRNILVSLSSNLMSFSEI